MPHRPTSLLTAEDVYGPKARSVPANRGAEWAPRLYWTVPATRRPEFARMLPDPGAFLNVYANQGRWVVTCPDCNGSQLACRTDPRFLCTDCGNVAVEGRWRRLAWPANYRDIETELVKRPTANQNWFPHESINDLREQNLLRGLGEPKNGDPIPIDLSFVPVSSGEAEDLAPPWQGPGDPPPPPPDVEDPVP